MPIVTTTAETLLASCMDPLCEGYTQTEVDGLCELRELTFGELDGGAHSADPRSSMIANAVERSMEHFWFKHERDQLCPHCGGPRIIARQERPVYARTSRTDPLELLRIQGRLARDAQGAGQTAELAALRAELAQTRVELVELRMSNGNGHSAPATPPETPSDATRGRKATRMKGDEGEAA